MSKAYYIPFLFFLSAGLGGCDSNKQVGPEDEPPSQYFGASECTDGLAAEEFPCENVDLLAHLPIDSLEVVEDTLLANDIWGWTDPETGKEYALVGLTDGVSFVDISDPEAPVVIGKLRESEMSSKTVVASGSPFEGAHLQHDDEGKGESTWRDMKVYNDYMFVVSDAQPHGLQVFDLTRLRDMDASTQEYSEDALYSEFGNAHNIAINEETGFAYVVGSNTYGGGLHIVDIRNPLQPEFAGFHADSTVGLRETGYVHDTQCVVYRGPDEDYQGDEVCFNSSETHLVLANVTDKSSTYTISKSTYEGNAYAHQGWLTEDQQYFLLDDEVDEMRNHNNTRTYIWDVRDLDDPQLIGEYTSTKTSIDHNQFVKGNYTYQANYTSGLRILDISNIASGSLEEVAYFDTQPADDRPEFRGAWSNYPYFKSGVVVVSDIADGLFILRPTF